MEQNGAQALSVAATGRGSSGNMPTWKEIVLDKKNLFQEKYSPYPQAPFLFINK